MKTPSILTLAPLAFALSFCFASISAANLTCGSVFQFDTFESALPPRSTVDSFDLLNNPLNRTEKISEDRNRYNFEDISLITAQDNRGKFLKYTQRGSVRGYLPTAIDAFPAFFSRYEIFKHDQVVLIPTAERLNPLLKGHGIAIVDLLPGQNQNYSQSFFMGHFKKREIPIATLDEMAYHDRLDTHLLGMLITRPWMMERFDQYFRFETALQKMPAFKNLDPASKETFTTYYISTAQSWEGGSAYLGQRFFRLAAAKKQGENLTQKEKIEFMEAVFLRVANYYLSPSAQIKQYLENPHVSVANKEMLKKMQPAVEKAERQFPQQVMTKEFAREQALQMIRAIEAE